MQWPAIVSVSTGTASPAFTRFRQSGWFPHCSHSSAATEAVLCWWLLGTPTLPGCPFSSSTLGTTYICGRPRSNSADEARSSTGWGPPHAGPHFFFASSTLSLSPGRGGRHPPRELPPLLPTTAGSGLDCLSSVAPSRPLHGHQRRCPCLPATPVFYSFPCP